MDGPLIEIIFGTMIFQKASPPSALIMKSFFNFTKGLNYEQHVLYSRLFTLAIQT